VKTLQVYEWWLRRLLAAIPEVTPLAAREFFMDLQAPECERETP
jgi:hypothetical protein